MITTTSSNHTSSILPSNNFISFSQPSNNSLWFSSLHSINNNKLSLHRRIITVSSIANTVLFDYLVDNLGFSESQANLTSKRFPLPENAANVDNVVCYLQQQGLSDDHIQTIAQANPEILFVSSSNVEDHQQVLVTNINILKEILLNDPDHKYLMRVIRRCKSIVTTDPEKFLIPNISLLKSYGIVGSQLSMLLKHRPMLFVRDQESCLRVLIQRAEDYGFSSDSRMFAHAIVALSSVGPENIQKKMNLFRSFGFIEEECLSMFRRTPSVMNISCEKLRSGLKYFMNVLGVERSALVAYPTSLTFSIEKRVIPRYRVLEILYSKELLDRNFNVLAWLMVPEMEFLDKYIYNFTDSAEELLTAYKEEGLESEIRLKKFDIFRSRI